MKHETTIEIHLHSAYQMHTLNSYVSIKLNGCSWWTGTEREFLLMFCAVTTTKDIDALSVVSQLLSVFTERTPHGYILFGEAGRNVTQTLVMSSSALNRRKSLVEIAYLWNARPIFYRTITEREYTSCLRSKRTSEDKAFKHLSRFLLLVWTDARTSQHRGGFVAALTNRQPAILR